MLNKSILMGRLTKDPELRMTGNQLPVATFTIAIDRKFKDASGNKQVDFINCVAWRKTAELISQHFTKGRMIAVIGSIQVRSWDDKEGNKRYATEVIVDEFSFTGDNKQQTSQQGYTPDEPTPFEL